MPARAAISPMTSPHRHLYEHQVRCLFSIPGRW